MSLIEVYGPHLAEVGSASALWFQRAAEHYTRHTAEVDAAREDGTLDADTGRDAWCAGRAAEREGSEAPGYAGRDFDPEIATDAANVVDLVEPEIRCRRAGPLEIGMICPCEGCQAIPRVREYAVAHHIAAGSNEARARRSVTAGMMRALNPAGGIKGGRYRAPTQPTNPTEPKRCA